MPNMWTHMIFGQELLQKVRRSDLLKDELSKRVFQLGCQGPDFLFYHNFWPWKKDHRLSVLGNRIHHEQCGPFLVDMVRMARGKELNDPAILYVLGFITHHVLDRNMHPYINYKSGFKKWNHQRLEVIIDTLMAKRFLGIETWKTPVWKEIYVGEDFPDGVVNIFEALTEKYFPDAADAIREEEWTEAYRDMIKAQKIFYDPTGIKRILTFGQIEPMVYKKTLAPLDYLNEAKKEWNDPTSLSEIHKESFMDLWNQALRDGEAVLLSVLTYLTKKTVGPVEEERMVTKIGNRSYDTGKDCTGDYTIKYVKPIL